VGKVQGLDEDEIGLEEALRIAGSDDHAGAVFVDRRGDGWRAGSFLAWDPCEIIEWRQGAQEWRQGEQEPEVGSCSGSGLSSGGRGPFETLQDAVSLHPELFWAGFLAYDAGRFVERTPCVCVADTAIPYLCFVGYRRVTMLASLGRNVQESHLIADLAGGKFRRAPEPLLESDGVAQSLDRKAYCEAVQKALEAIRAGDFYQVNIAHRISVPTGSAARLGSPVAAPRNPHSPGGSQNPGDATEEAILAFKILLHRLRPPRAAYLRCSSHHVVSASPELFLEVDRSFLRTRPMKGTRPRAQDPASDRALAEDLAASPKDRAENVMIVDLLRNDLGKIAEPATVAVPKLFVVETYPTVHQMVSEVTAIARSDVGIGDVLRALFPGGSVTGAPKPAAMAFIESVEQVRRGVYTGAVGYIDPAGYLSGLPSHRRPRLVAAAHGDRAAAKARASVTAGPALPTAEFSVAIRTLVRTPNRWDVWVGAGIVADSLPEKEWDETLVKAEGLLAAAVSATECTNREVPIG
jgi:anthranilate/para-aminobenzoate synthase component I